MHALEAAFLLPVYSEIRASRFMEMGWELVTVNHCGTAGIPEFILGWNQALPAPSPEGGVFDIENGQWKFKAVLEVVA